ncbi:MAG: competence/damage-inducible protein A [Lachnospiraceae bacterium]|nr:competence/damage-inducible protein A [Lachnospiraceae bacterium]
MTAEIICVGTELLLGNVINTNAAYLSEQLAALGISCYYHTVVGDNKERLAEALQIASKRAELLILSGGLGPTQDDLTKETAAEFCGKKLILDNRIKKQIEEYFAKRGIRPADNNWKQALIPEDGIVFENHNGTAPGLAMEAKNIRMILLPGPPEELMQMFQESAVPYLRKISPGVIASQTVKTCGITESRVADILRDLIEKQDNPTIATYAKLGEVHIRVTAKAESQKEAGKLLKPMIKELKARFGNDVYTAEEDVTLEKALVDLLESSALTISCAESCTGGLLSGRLINVPGVSELYKAGLITYSNKAKRKLLGVKKATLQKYGAVSKQTAEEMAKGLLNVTKTDVGVAVTGIAGPDGGTKEKPVGLVYISCNVKGKITVKECHFQGSREKIRLFSVAEALRLTRSCVLEYLSRVTFGN